MIDWRPIDEGTPKGERVLLYHKPRVDIGTCGANGWVAVHRNGPLLTVEDIKPTHWAPLNPPEAE